MQVVVTTRRPSRDLRVLPTAGGRFQIEPFYTSDCDFNCYDVEVFGYWRANGPSTSAEGRIVASITGRGVGADARAVVANTDFPQALRLDDLSWNANTGGARIPGLISAEIGGAALLLNLEYGTFEVARNLAVSLPRNER